MKITFILAVLFGIGFLIYNKGNKLDSSKFAVIETISKKDLKSVILNDSTIQLVDVRKQVEFDKGFIEPAILIDYFRKDFVTKFQKFDKDKPIYLYCRSGNRSGKAAKLLSQEGFTKIYDLEGGFLNWESKD